MKKLFTLFVAVLVSFSLWAASESNPTEVPAKDNAITGVSYTIDGTYNAGASGSKVDPMPNKGVKFRTNKTSGSHVNAIEFTVNQGHVINGITLVGVTNSDDKAATLGSIYVDGTAWNGTFETTLAAKNASAASTIEISGIAAEQSVVFVFSNLNGSSQALICYTVTYDESAPKQIVSTVEELINAKVNGEALEEGKLNDLKYGYLATLDDYFITAPEVTFVKRVEITYDDQSTKVDTVDVEVTAIESLEYSGMWQASITIGETTYSLIAGIAEAYTVTYKEGEQVLGTELVAVNGNPAEFAKYEKKPLATFDGWFKDAELTQKVESMAAEVISADVTFYAKFSKAYASSLNIEQLVLDLGTKANIDSILTARGYIAKDRDGLDSLNDAEGKVNRNYPFLGLKMKKATAVVGFNLKAGDKANIRFGNMGAECVVVIGEKYDTIPTSMANIHPDSANAVNYETDQDVYIEIRSTSTKTLVLKQIMINEDIAPVVLPGEGGGEETKDTDATIKSLTINGVAVTAVEGVYAYEVPADENLAQVEVVYTLNSDKATADPASGFKVDVPAAGEAANTQLITVTAESGDKKEYTVSVTRASSEAIGNTDATTKAVKVIRNGQLVIIRDSKEFNVLGAQTK